MAFEEKTLLVLLNKKNGRLVLALARLVMIGVVSGRTRLLLGGVDDDEEEGLAASRLAFELNTLLCLVRRRRRTIVVVADDGEVAESRAIRRMRSMVTDDGIKEVVVVVEGAMMFV